MHGEWDNVNLCVIGDFKFHVVTTSLNENYYKDGYDLAIENSKSLFKIAEITGVEKQFGIACSLNILSAEEALKASFLIIKHYNPNGKINEFEKIFHNHRIKHQQLRQFVEFQDKMQATIKNYISFFEPLVILGKKMSFDTNDKLKKEQESIEETFEWLKGQSEIKLNFGEIINWLENANTDKNKGFYVDQFNKKWSAPKNTTKGKFDTEKKYTEAIIHYATNIEELFRRVTNEKDLRQHRIDVMPADD